MRLTANLRQIYCAAAGVQGHSVAFGLTATDIFAICSWYQDVLLCCVLVPQLNIWPIVPSA